MRMGSGVGVFEAMYSVEEEGAARRSARSAGMNGMGRVTIVGLL